MKTKFINLMTVLALCTGSVACSKIPAAYRGTFEDRGQGAKLVIKATKAQLTFSDGRELKSKAEDLNFEAISSGKPGIFVRENSANPDLLEIFWLNPNVATRQVVEGFVWFDAEMIYTFLDTKITQSVPGLQLLHCTNGSVMVDTATQTFQMGCPEQSPALEMVRIQK